MRSALVCLLTIAAAAQASEIGDGVKYVAPEGFAGHTWGEVRAAFHRLPAEPSSVGAAWMRIQEKQTAYSCQLTTWLPKYIETWIPQCKYDETLRHPNSDFKAGGTYVVSEYTIEDQGFRYGDEKDGVVLHPVIYQFCANWHGRRKRPPPQNFDDLNKFCGMKFLFKSETADELAALPGDHVSAYDRVLNRLIAKYGKPLGFTRRGKVFIDTMDSESIESSSERFRTWRWCPAPEAHGLRTQCAASLTLTLDRFSGEGAVLYSTPILWEFAYARENFGFEGDPLYRVLHARE
jgi:hypothetical protein